MLRLIIAMAITLLPAASLAAGETWTPVGTTVQPEKKSSLSLDFEIEEIRGYATGCSALACQIALPNSWPHRARFADRWYGQCKEALIAAHAGNADWNFRDLRITGDQPWLNVPGRGEQNGARFLCLKQERKAERAPLLPPVSVAPVDGDRAETFDARAGRAEPPPPPTPPPPPPPVLDTPPIKAEPAPAAPKMEIPPAPRPREFIAVEGARERTRTSSASERFLRVITGVCGGARWDRGYEELGASVCGVAGLEARLWILLAGAEIELGTQPGGQDTLTFGATGHLSLVLGGFELGGYLRGAPVLAQEGGDPPAKHYVDWGVRLGIPIVDEENWGMVLVLYGSIGSRARLAEQHYEGYFYTSGDTLGFGGRGLLAARFPVL